MLGFCRQIGQLLIFYRPLFVVRLSAAVFTLQLIYKSHAKLLSRLMDLILTVTSGKWKTSISLAVHVEAAIDTCVRSVMLLPASYKELRVCSCNV